jgi:NAD(P)-dependent dehydrogenase (short-subunit alcohol dehydrogenase family)
LATAKRFVSEGAYVFIIDLHKKELDSALSNRFKNVVGIEGDVSNIGGS